MKKSTLRAAIWITLVVVSISSYFYLNCQAMQFEDAYSMEEKQVNEEEEAQNESKVLLPDIALVKKIFDVSKLILNQE